jgi:hypothetical protein
MFTSCLNLHLGGQQKAKVHLTSHALSAQNIEVHKSIDTNLPNDGLPIIYHSLTIAKQTQNQSAIFLKKIQSISASVFFILRPRYIDLFASDVYISVWFRFWIANVNFS